MLRPPPSPDRASQPHLTLLTPPDGLPLAPAPREPAALAVPTRAGPAPPRRAAQIPLQLFPSPGPAAGLRRLRRGLKLDPVSEGQCVNTRRAPRARGRGRCGPPGLLRGPAPPPACSPRARSAGPSPRSLPSQLAQLIGAAAASAAASGRIFQPWLPSPSRSCYLGWQLVGGGDGPSADPGLRPRGHPSSSGGGGVGGK